MKLKDYIQDHLISILLYLSTMIIIVMLLAGFRIEIEIIYGIIFVMMIMGSIIILIEYYRKKAFYNHFLNLIQQLDQKYLIMEMTEEPNFLEGKLLYESLLDINRSMIEHLNEYQESITDFKEYIEMWIHEVKIPLASLNLLVHNHPELPGSFQEAISKLENHVNQVLYYVRSENAEKDYLIKPINLKSLVRTVAINHKNDLLVNDIAIHINQLDYEVYSDPKWLEFMIGQIIHNSIKYKKEKGAMIEISAMQEGKSIILSIYDNGIGIIEGDLPKVFNKSFTGYNGRIKAKSTGMGLYIAKKLCDKLGHEISIESKVNEYTIVKIIFAMNDYYEVL